MRYRNIVTSKIEALEGKMKTLKRMVQRQEPVSDFIKTIEEAEEMIEAIQSTIQREPVTNDEISR